MKDDLILLKSNLGLY